ncbi:hypothetical protein OROGR_009936 [Orobanche gracilis]
MRTYAGHDDNFLTLLAEDIGRECLSGGDTDKTRFDLHVIEYLFSHMIDLLKEKAKFQQSSMATSATTEVKEAKSKVKEAAEKCWDIFSVEDRVSSYIPYVISRCEDIIRVLLNRLEELESKWRDKSLKREIFATSMTFASFTFQFL